MKIKTLLLIGCSIFCASAMNAQTHDEEPITPIVHIRKMDKQVSELMADRVTIRKEMELKELAELSERSMMTRENLLFPAEDLYGDTWDSRHVDPFAGAEKVNLPDSFAIDCSSFIYPIAIDSIARITSKYGPRRRRMHKGIDLKVLRGDSIRAAFDGKVRIKAFERRGYGYYVVLRHPNGLETVYGHLSKILVSENQVVRAGETIGLGGNTGRSTGSHLHFETRFLGQAINPSEIIDFENGVPHQDIFVFRNVKINGRRSNIYTSSTDQMVYHRVKSGETLSKIAKMYGMTVNQLCRLNSLNPNAILRIGQSLRCSADAGGSTAKPASNPQPVQKATATKKIEVVADAAAVASLEKEIPVTNDDNAPVYHRIKSGDTLSSIAAKYGTTVSKLCELNGISRTTILKLGRSLRCS